jgi:hypothetical protein
MKYSKQVVKTVTEQMDVLKCDKCEQDVPDGQRALQGFFRSVYDNPFHLPGARIFHFCEECCKQCLGVEVPPV